jgi:hypothetical protein
MYLIGAISGSLAILATYLSTTRAILLAVSVIVAVLVGVALLEHAPYEKQAKKAVTAP